jgi:type VI secretion system secreted protein Hcp
MAFDTYLKIEGVDGESTTKGLEKQMEIFSFSWGASNPTTVGSGATGLSAGRVSVSSFHVMKKTEKSSALLFQACCSGKHFPTAELTMRKAGGDAGQLPFLKYKFEDVLIESVQWSGSTGGDDSPTESLSLAFGKCEVEYQQQSADGNVGNPVLAAWDIRTVSA